MMAGWIEWREEIDFFEVGVLQPGFEFQMIYPVVIGPLITAHLTVCVG